MKRCCMHATDVLLLAAFAASSPVAFPQPVSSQTETSQTEQAQAITPEVRGDLAMVRQQYIAAIEDYSRAPLTSAVIWNKIGMAYHHMFAMDEARRDYQRALRLRPDYPEALNNLGAVYYSKKNYKKAVRYYRKALKIDPKAASVYSNLGTAYFAERKVDLGLEAYRTAFALDPHVFEASTDLVIESLPAHDRALQDYCMAKLFAQSGHLDRALDYLRRALNEGFDDRRKILEDQTLASLRATPQFAQLMTEEKLR